MKHNQPTRRNFLRLAGGAVAGAGLAGILGCHDDKKTVIVQGDGVSPYCNRPASTASTRMKFTAPTIDQLYLEFVNKEWTTSTFPLIRNGGLGALVTGDGFPLHTVEGTDMDIGDYFVLNKTGSDFTHVLQYVNHDPANRILTFTDSAFGNPTRQVTYDPATGQADLIVGGITYTTAVNPNGSISVDQDGDGVVSNTQARIVNRFGGVLLLDDTPEPEPAHLRFITAKEAFCGTEDEVIDMYVRKAGQAINLEVPDQKDVTFSYDASSGLWVGITKGYGAKIELNKSTIPNTADILYPN